MMTGRIVKNKSASLRGRYFFGESNVCNKR
jgi:hypothetical protein